MEEGKLKPQLGLNVLTKLGAAIRDEADMGGEAELPPHMRFLLTRLQEIGTPTQEQPVDPSQNPNAR
jgi:hypothetical protein